MDRSRQTTNEVKDAHEVARNKEKRFLKRRKTRRGRQQKGPTGFLLHRNGLDVEVLTSSKSDSYIASKKGTGIVVRSFGNFKNGSPYHTRHYFLCKGFRSHVVNKSTLPWTDIFQNDILDGGEAGPLFRVTDLRPGAKSPPITRRTPGRAWWEVFKRINSGAGTGRGNQTKAKSIKSPQKCHSSVPTNAANARQGWGGAKRVRVRIRVNGRSKVLRTNVLLAFRPYFCKEEPDLRNLRGSEVGECTTTICQCMPCAQTL